MAPSPELGQPKAPDKRPSTSLSSIQPGGSTSGHQNENLINNNVVTCANNTTAAAAATTICKMKSSNDNNITNSSQSTSTTTTNSLENATSSSISASSAAGTQINANSQPQNLGNTSSGSSNAAGTANASNVERTSKNLWHWDEDQIKKLLDEAFSYKNPKDRENKSEIFLQLLQTAERKEEESAYSFRSITSRYPRGSNSHKHGGSLQDLDEAALNDSILDSDYTYDNRNRRHHHNSRPKKYSLVSSRQREGGSLPSNVNAPNCNLSTFEQPFLNEVSKRRGKNERTCSGTSCASGTSGTSSTVSACGHDSLSSCQNKDDTHTNSSGDTIIDINDSFLDETQHLIAHDTLSQIHPEEMEFDEGIELSTVKKVPRATIVANTVQGKQEICNSEPKQFDEIIKFQSLERSKNVESTCVSLNENYKACKSVLGDKVDVQKPQTAMLTTKPITKCCDENGNSLNSPFNSCQTQPNKTKKKKSQSERNTTTLNLKAVVGYRGEDTVEELVKFIENTDNKKNDKNLNVSKKKEKKKEKEKDVKKVKKSNSLEELRSCTKLDEDEKVDSSVTMRSKAKKINATVMISNDGKENLKQQNHKRGERRSWGTEELTYLGENNALEEVREKVKEKEKTKKSKDIEKHEKIEKTDLKKKKDDSSLHTPILVDTFQCESAEFHVVTKKKKPKKRQHFEDSRPGGGKCVSMKDSGIGNHSAHKKYQTSSQFTNDRDVYFNALNANESRRKSTSSVPPSEKSDSSDLDSVHSLPVESTSNRHHNSSHLLAGSVVSPSSAAMIVAAASNMSSLCQPQSYADIARTVNQNKYSNTITSPSTDKTDKWPAVSSLSCSNSTNISFTGTAIVEHSNFGVVKSNRKSLSRDFPDLVSDKTNNNDAGSSCSSTSSTSTIVKQISYSQSLLDEKNMYPAGAKSPTSTSNSKLVDVVKATELTKQTLQKSKSMENDSYYGNMDQYPALEKTVKRHATQSFIHEQNNPITNPKQQQQQRSPVSPSATVIGNTFTITTTPSTPPIVTPAIDTKSKIIGFNSVDTSGTTPVTSPLNPNPININVKKVKQSQQQQQQNHGQLNTKVVLDTTQIVSSVVEANNAKNKQLITSTTTTTNAVSEPLNSSNNDITVSSKKLKSDTQLLPQQSLASSNPSGRKTKKDKNNQTSTSNSCCNSHKTTSSMTHLNSSSSKASNRPAVIILNDTSENSLSIRNDFTFGDFNEEELRLFDSSDPYSQPLEDSGNVNQTMTDSTIGMSTSVDAVVQSDDTLHLSPRSDCGYSSSNSRSILSESIDNNKAEPENASLISSTPAVININNDSSCSSSKTGDLNFTRKSLSQTSGGKLFSNEIISANSSTNLGTNSLLISSTNKTHSSCNSNIINISNDLCNDPCIIAVSSNVSSVNNNLINNTISCKNASNISQGSTLTHQQTQQLVNQLLVTSSSSALSLSSNSKIYNTESGISSKNDNANNNNNDVATIDPVNSSVSSPVSTTSSAKKQLSNNEILNNETVATSSHVTTASLSTEIESSSGTEAIKKINTTEVNIRYIPPTNTPEMNSISLEKIVDFVGTAWEEVLHGGNYGLKFYNGQ